MSIKINEYNPKFHTKWVIDHDFVIFNNNKSHYKESAFKKFKGWVAYFDNKLAGSCLYDIDDDNETNGMRQQWYFAYLGILPKYQKKGLGTILLSKLLEYADLRRAHLECNTHNTNLVALTLYKKNDFVVSDTGEYMTLTRRPKPKIRFN